MHDWDPFKEMDERPKLDCVVVENGEIRPGDRVRIRPLGRADIFDLILDGKTATVLSIEQDFENRVHVAVSVDDDPGRDYGVSGKPGHRFFFGIDEVEPLSVTPEG
jgi:hypothetical protein